MTATHLQPVSNSVPDYPFDPDLRLPGHHYIPIDFNRFQNSTFGLRADLEVQGLFLRLVMIAQTQRPVGTLPPDPIDLALLCRIDLARFKKLTDGDLGALYGWQRCLADDEVRLMHPVVNEMIEFAVKGRAKRQAGASAEAARTRKKRLRDGLRAHGCIDALLSDDVLIDRMDQWMTANVKGNRTHDAYGEVLKHAVNEGWIGGPR